MSSTSKMRRSWSNHHVTRRPKAIHAPSFQFGSIIFVVFYEGSLAVGESMQIHVQFKAVKTGDYDCNMVLHYDTGMEFMLILIL